GGTSAAVSFIVGNSKAPRSHTSLSPLLTAEERGGVTEAGTAHVPLSNPMPGERGSGIREFPVAGDPSLSINSAHTGNFTRGQTGAAYIITVSNPGAAPISDTVTVTDGLPAGLTATAIEGAG